jgi:hypothetical protein
MVISAPSRRLRRRLASALPAAPAPMITTFALVWTGGPLTAALASVEGSAASAPPAAASARKARRVLSKSRDMGGFLPGYET